MSKNSSEEIGWVKLHRKLLDSRVFANADMLKLWLLCLCQANHQDGWVDIDDLTEPVEVKRGQFVTGRYSLHRQYYPRRKKTNKSPLTVWRWVQKLEKWGKLNIKTYTKYSVIEIANYDYYQKSGSDEQADEQRVNNSRTTGEQRVNTNKNDKNVKNDKNNSIVSDSTDDTPAVWSKRLIDISEDEIKVGKDAGKDSKIDYLAWRMHQMLNDDIGHYVNYRKARLKDWREPVRLLEQEDGVNFHKQWDLFRFARQDEFWNKNLQSTSGLRKNIDQIMASYEKEHQTKTKIVNHRELEAMIHSREYKAEDFKTLPEKGPDGKARWKVKLK